jgi:hypothetical protein
MTSKYWTSHKESSRNNNKASGGGEMKLSEQQRKQQQQQHQRQSQSREEEEEEEEERARQKNKDTDSMSCSDSIEENVVTIKATNMESENNDANVQTHSHDTAKSFTAFRSPHSKRRPDSLKLSFAYGSSSDLGKSVFSNSDVNQTKSLSVDGNKSHHSGKKSTSYDLWVNESALKVASAGEGEVGKKLDLPGRVSFR